MPFGLFTKKPDVKQQVRESRREIRQGTRGIEREIAELKREEAKLVREIKAAAKSGNEGSAKVLAKSLVRVRAQMSKLNGSAAQLKGVGVQITTAAATNSVANAMGKASETMAGMNTAMNPAKVNADMAQFAKENARMEMTSEIMNDAVDDALDGEDVEEEGDTLVNQVLDEIGIDMTAAAPAARTGKVAQQQQQQLDAEDEAVQGEMDAIEARLQQLKGS